MYSTNNIKFYYLKFMMAKRTYSILSDYCISQCYFYLINKDFRKQSVRRFYPANLEFPFLFCFLFSNSAVFTISDHKSLIHTCKNIIGKVRVTNHNYFFEQIPLRSKKTERFEKLLGFSRSHFIVARGSVSLSCATTPHPSCFSKF